jgi:DNA helicase-2/ATP-dependent DNA helicase PcrA
MNYEMEMLPKALNEKLSGLKNLLTDLENNIQTMSMSDFFSYLLERSGITESFDTDNEQEYERYLNINSLLTSIIQFEENNEGATIVDFLESVTLSSAMDSDDGTGVVIATVHGSKGLEFANVFIVGCEEGIFPIRRDDATDTEEARRLMYVAITRARKNLFLTSASSRFLYGKREFTVKSKFLTELDLIKPMQINSGFSSYNNNTNYGNFKKYGDNNMNNTLQTNNSKLFNYTFGKDTEKKTIDTSKIKVGAKVVHPKFGEGEITEVTPNSSNHCVKIKFETVGEKMLSLEYAPIEFKD